jgi:predicted enzyme related to lactoylglutathione lyase
MCDDIETTVDDLEKKGVTFTRPITGAAWGRVTALALPDGRDLTLYEPRHPTPSSPDL